MGNRLTEDVGNTCLRYISYSDNSNLIRGIGTHTNPAAEGDQLSWFKYPDIYLEYENATETTWSNIVPIVEGYLCRPCVVGNRLYAVEGSQYGQCSGTKNTVEVGGINFSAVGSIQIVPFTECTLSLYSITVPSRYNVTDTVVFMVSKGRLVVPSTIVDQTITNPIHYTQYNNWSRYDRILKSSADAVDTRTETVRYTDTLYPISPRYAKEGFLILVTPSSTVSDDYYEQSVQLERNRILFQGAASGIVTNSLTGLIRPSYVQKRSANQTEFFLKGTNYHQKIGDKYPIFAEEEPRPHPQNPKGYFDEEYATHTVRCIRSV